MSGAKPIAEMIYGPRFPNARSRAWNPIIRRAVGMLHKMAMAPTNIRLSGFLYPPAPIINMAKVIKAIAMTRFTDTLIDFPGFVWSEDMV
jgi:hypothetical protein